MNKIPCGITCPACYSEISEVHCHHCGHKNLVLGEVLCVSPVPEAQLNLWRHQLYTLQQVSQGTVDYFVNLLARADNLPSTRQRFEHALESAMLSRDFVVELFDSVGLTPRYDPKLEGAPVGILSEYYCHIVRDWAWQEDVSGSYLDQLRTLLKVWPKNYGKRVLVLGPGAGRVAWELHCELGDVETTTLELNPALQLISNKLINGQALPLFPESSVSPQLSVAESFECWELQAVQQADQRLLDSFHQLVGDFWQLEFVEGSFDCIITSWFLDAHGRDNRDYLEKISRWLKPGGYWINTGPLLYPQPLPPELKYSHQELTSLFSLARFNSQAESVDVKAHLPSPLSVKKQFEEIWTFCMQFEPQVRSSLSTTDLPDWLVLHYLPILKSEICLSADDPVVNAVYDLIDDRRSINDISAILAQNLPPDTDAKGALLAFISELLPQPGTSS